MEKDASEVEWVATLPDEANGDPALWSCLVFLPGCQF